MSTKDLLDSLAQHQSVRILTDYEDEFTPITCQCERCYFQWEDYSQVLLDKPLWCEQCRLNPYERLKPVCEELHIKIVDQNIRNMIDYKLERGGKTAFLLLVKSNDIQPVVDMAAKVGIKLIILPQKVVFELSHQDLLRFLEDAMQSSEKKIQYTVTGKSTVESSSKEEKSEEQSVDELLAESGYPQSMVNRISDDSYSYVSKPVTIPTGAREAFLYARISSKMQLSDTSHSIPAQIAIMKNYCQFEKLFVSTVFFDLAMTGKNANRPALKSLLTKLKPGVTVVVASLSRLARNVKNSLEILELIDQKQAYLTLLDMKVNTNTPLGRMLFQVLSSLAEFETSQTSERISNVMSNMSSTGTLRPKPPYGWEFVGKNVPWKKIPREQAMIAYVRQLRLDQPALTISQLCRHLNKLKDPGLRKETKKWYDSSLTRLMLANDIPLPLRNIDDKLAEEYKKKKQVGFPVDKLTESSSESV